MDRLRTCTEALRVLAMQSHNPSSAVITEIRIDEFVYGGVPWGRVALEQLGQAIEAEEAQKRQGEDWTVAKEYVRSRRKKLA